MPEEKTPELMPARERNELIRIIKGRFKLLRLQAGQRASEIVTSENQRLELEAKEQFRDWYARMDAINEESAPLFEAANQFVRDLQEQRITFSGSYGAYKVLDLKLHPKRSYYSQDIRMHVMAEIDAAELAVIEEILMGSIETEAARSLLARVPTIEELVSGEKVLAIIDRQ